MAQNDISPEPEPSLDGVSRSPSPASDTHNPSARRPQHKLTKEERAYLSTRLPEYHALQATLALKGDGPRGVRHVKGNKKEWVKSNVFEDFKVKFNSAAPGGSALDSVFKAVCIWFNNNRDKTIGSKKAINVSLPKSSAKRPRAKSAKDLFAEEHKAKLNTALFEHRLRSGADTQQNLPGYNRLKDDFFDALPQSEQAAYEEKAAKRNSELRKDPPSSHIFENQKALISTTIRALHELTGKGWGQHGDAVFFVMGAYTDENGRTNTFNASVGGENQSDSTAPFNFLNDFPGNYQEDLRKPFKQWAKQNLPDAEGRDIATKSTPAGRGLPSSLTILYRMDGRPLLPTMNFDEIIEGIWEFTLSEESLGRNPSIPWDLLNSTECWHTLLADTKPFSHFRSLDPSRMAAADIYNVLTDLSSAQREDRVLLKFNLTDDVITKLGISKSDPDSVDQDIDEVPDPDVITRAALKPAKKKGRSAGKRKRVVSESDGSESKGSADPEDVPDFSPPTAMNPPAEMTTPQVPINPVGTGLPEHVIISALEAVFAYNSAARSDIPPAMHTPPSSFIPPRPSESADNNRPGKRVRLVEPETSKTNSEAPHATTAIALTTNKKGKAATKKKLTGAVDNVASGSKMKVSATKVPKPLPPARKSSKRINADGYKNTAVTIRRGA